MRFFILVFIMLFGISPPLVHASAVHASEAESTLQNKRVIRGSGLPVPRFVSVKTARANMRVGPGHEYPLDWIYVRQHLPLKVISEFDVWRKIIDHQGVSGWIHTSLLSSRRYALITKSDVVLRDDPSDEARLIARADIDLLLEIQYCRKDWCRLAKDGVRGWVRRDILWGVLPDEVLE